jgi:hypothetical protein
MIWACSIQTEPRASASVVPQAFLPVFRVSPAIASLLKEEKHRHECLCYSGRASAHVLVAAMLLCGAALQAARRFHQRFPQGAAQHEEAG